MGAEPDDDGRPAAAAIGSWRHSVCIPLVLIGVTVVTGALGTYNDLVSSPAYRAVPTREIVLESVFASLSFLVLNSGPYPLAENATPLLVYVGRTTGVLFFSYAAVLGFSALFAAQLKPLRIRAWHLRDRLGPGDADGHRVVCGVGHKGFELASSLLADGHDVVVVEQDGGGTRTSELSDRGALVLYGDATRRRTLERRARVQDAAEVFVNCGSDRTNTRVVQTVADVLDDGRAEGRLVDEYVTCRAHVESRRRRHFVHEQFQAHSRLRLSTYDTANATARELLQRRPVGRFEGAAADGRTHVVLVGWSRLTRAMVFELCQLMHYVDGHDRQITVVCRDPATARAAVAAQHPALDPDHWDRASVRAFADHLFPDLSFLQLPANEDVLLSDQFDLYDRLQPGETLTLVVTTDDEFRSASLVAAMLPRLEGIDSELDLDTEIQYFAESGTNGADGRGIDDDFRIESETIPVRPFGEFVDECTPATVRGEHRDRVARRMALFFHLRYDYDPTAPEPTAVDEALAAHLPLDPPTDSGYGYETVATLWEQLSDERRATLAEFVWQHLSETNRDANRHAADHAAVKHRLDAALSTNADRDAVLARLAEAEHRRW